MPDFLVETVSTVEVEDGQGGAMVINQSDFDPTRHKLYGVAAAPVGAVAAPTEAPTEAAPKRRRSAPAAAPPAEPPKRRRRTTAAVGIERSRNAVSPEAAIEARVKELQHLYELKDGTGGPAAIEAIAQLLGITKPKSGWRAAFKKIAQKELEVASAAAADPTE